VEGWPVGDIDLETTRRIERPMAKKAAPKAAAKASAPKAATGEKSGKAKPATKGEVFSHLAEKTNLAKKDVAAIFTALEELVHKELKSKTGTFIVPGLLKLTVDTKPATKAKQGINPFTKEPMTIKAKPARKVVKARPLKALKDAV
jgi:nucleoid DNA-binding protein